MDEKDLALRFVEESHENDVSINEFCEGVDGMENQKCVATVADAAHKGGHVDEIVEQEVQKAKQSGGGNSGGGTEKKVVENSDSSAEQMGSGGKMDIPEGEREMQFVVEAFDKCVGGNNRMGKSNPEACATAFMTLEKRMEEKVAEAKKGR